MLVHGLASDAGKQLNGKSARLKGWLADGGRWAVVLEVDGAEKEMSLRSDNLVLEPPDDPRERLAAMLPVSELPPEAAAVQIPLRARAIGQPMDVGFEGEPAPLFTPCLFTPVCSHLSVHACVFTPSKASRRVGRACSASSCRWPCSAR